MTAHIRSLEQKGVKVGSILTFDPYGISGHPNHQGVHRACKKIFESREFPELSIYYLESVPMYKSYTFWLDIFNCDGKKVNYFLESSWETWDNMYIHYTQYIWTRRLFMPFYRYSFYNSLEFHPAGSSETPTEKESGELKKDL